MSANQKLKALRNNRNITIREVELESQRIADAKGDKRFYISDARLTQLENDPLSAPSFWKLFTLGTIYQVRITEMLRLYNVDADESEKYYAIANSGNTQLLSEAPKHYRTIESLKTLITDPAKTTLLRQLIPKDDKSDVLTRYTNSQSISYGYIGLDDFTIYPLIRPGSFVEIDTHQNKLRLIPWRSKYERPIYFVELRDSYACGWCELQRNQLLIIPYQSSATGIRSFTYPQEIEIIGRVVEFTTSCVDSDLGVRERKAQI